MTTSPLAPRSHARYGWVPDLPDARDLQMAVAPETAPLPTKVDLRQWCPPVYNQGELGSCTANAIGAAYAFDLAKMGKPVFMPSRLFVYYNERVVEGTVDQDAGAMIRDGIKVLAKAGVPDEALWPYDITKFAVKPPQEAYDAALNHQAVLYRRIYRSLHSMRSVLASGKPFVFGFSVYEGFESSEVARTGVVQMPTRFENLLGGHAVLAVGYDDTAQRFLVRNSWGPSWGQGGYFTLPYAYLTTASLSSDFWTVTAVEG